jgi:hypothetical protein
MRGMGTRSRRLRYVATVVSLVTVAASGAVAGPASAEGRPTVLQILQTDSDKDRPDGYDHRWYDYDIFTRLMFVFDYERELLEDPNQALTLFAPKDYAFFRLAKQFGAPDLVESEVATWLFENVGAGPVEDTLLVHIELSRLSYGTMLRSDGRALAGGAVIDVRSGGRIKLVDLDPNDRDAYVIAPEHGGPAANGYVHGIGRVLRPFDLP